MSYQSSKRVKKSDPNNYRPVSFTSTVCKIMETIIRDKIAEHLEEQDLINKAQHGFRSGRSCCTQLLEVTQDWADAIEDKKPVDVIYLEYRKAFDSVPFERLLVKLYACGIRGKLLQWIREFLTNRKVSVNNHSSNFVPVTSGIPKGSVLRPIMFLIYVNGLPEVVISTVKLFADDTKLYRVIKNEEDKLQLQEDLNNLQKWSETWQLPFNVEKCSTFGAS